MHSCQSNGRLFGTYLLFQGLTLKANLKLDLLCNIPRYSALKFRSKGYKFFGNGSHFLHKAEWLCIIPLFCLFLWNIKKLFPRRRRSPRRRIPIWDRIHLVQAQATAYVPRRVMLCYKISRTERHAFLFLSLTHASIHTHTHARAKWKFKNKMHRSRALYFINQYRIVKLTFQVIIAN